MYASVHAFSSVYVQVALCVYEGQRMTFSVHDCFPSCLRWGAEGADSFWGFACLHFPALYSSNGITDTCYGIWICVDSGDMNSGAHDCMANNLTH